MDSAFFSAFNADLRNPTHWEQFYRNVAKKAGVQVDSIPPIPDVDGEFMFNHMMSASRVPDPWMWPALKKLKASGRYLIAALSNTMIFPEWHPLHKQSSEHDDVRGIFDVFISSAHIGLRKPDPKIYKYAVETLDKFAKENKEGEVGRKLGWGEGVKAGEIVFLDDIGENLKAARQAGFGTIKVNLGMAYEAVDELEKLTGLNLAGGHPRISSAPKIPRPKL